MARSLETLQVELRAHQDRSPDAAKLAAADAGLPAKAVPQLRSVIKGHERKVCLHVVGLGSRLGLAPWSRAYTCMWLVPRLLGLTPQAAGCATRPAPQGVQLGRSGAIGWEALPPLYHPTTTPLAPLLGFHLCFPWLNLRLPPPRLPPPRSTACSGRATQAASPLPARRALLG